MRLMKFDLKAINQVPGKGMYESDALSSLQNRNMNQTATLSNALMEAYVNNIIKAIHTVAISDTKLQMIPEAQEDDGKSVNYW